MNYMIHIKTVGVQCFEFSAFKNKRKDSQLKIGLILSALRSV